VDDVSFEVRKGRNIRMVEKVVAAKQHWQNDLTIESSNSGKIIYTALSLTAKKRDELRPLRKDLQLIFQDPYSSLNPRLTIGSAICRTYKFMEYSSDNNEKKK